MSYVYLYDVADSVYASVTYGVECAGLLYGASGADWFRYLEENASCADGLTSGMVGPSVPSGKRAPDPVEEWLECDWYLGSPVDSVHCCTVAGSAES